ncbi:hypothetical protein JOF53_005570 [Crossiella equi]|uniref:DUF4173 domain-containing protein n=1 Tax=Crossiella equi TaxID=130796 RepID=A0ABS5AJF0_9PSEU|nr:DUF4173 domain-containing protein [Crossiella equi]MBP2476698.1 hypothetical protein [Crossiella equi]
MDPAAGAEARTEAEAESQAEAEPDADSTAEVAAEPAPPAPALTPVPVPVRAHAPSTVVAASLTAGLAAAVLLPLDLPGLGWLLTGLVLTALVWLVARRDRAEPLAWPERLVRGGWAALALALLAVGAFRDAGWLFTLCVLGAAAAGSLAVSGGRSVLGAVAVPVRAVGRMGWFVHGLAAVRVRGSRGRLLVSAVVSLLLLLVFGALFAGADATFRELVSAALPTVDGPGVVRGGFVFVVLTLGTAGACLVAVRGFREPSAGTVRRVGVLEWALPVGVLVVLFGGFVAVQLAALFGGEGYVRRTAQLTYAEYARSGFWQLSAVSVLALAVIAAAVRWAPREHRAERVVLRVLPGALAVLTLVIVASAISRMLAYQEVYGSTVLRLLVLTCEIWIGFVYLVVLAAGIRLRGAWVPRIAVASGLLVLVGLAAANPEHLVAQHNVERGRVDLRYHGDLSADAVPALLGLPQEDRACLFPRFRNELAYAEERGGWRAWNLSRSRARSLLLAHADPSADCYRMSYRPR